MSKFIRIPSKVIGSVDGMKVLRPSDDSWDTYGNSLDCFFNVGDTIMLLDAGKYTEKELNTMTIKMKYKYMFEDKNYVLATILERTRYYVSISSRNNNAFAGIHKINQKQGYAEGIVYQTSDGTKHNCYCSYYLIGGLVTAAAKEKIK